MIEISNDIKLDFDNVRIEPKFGSIESRSEVVLRKTFHMPHSGEELYGTGIIAANMDGVGTFEVAKVLAKNECFTALHKNYSADELIDFYREVDVETDNFVFYSMGINAVDYEKFVYVKERALVDKICIDVANGYMDKFYDFIHRMRDEFPYLTIMVGNVVTGEAVEKAYEHGADIVKLGIGPGGMCTTRTQTGVGYPQLSCILDSVQAADECGVFICSDGGCSVPGHVSIAYAAGADFVMLGSMLAGTDEGGGEIIDGKIQFYGMSSKTANEKHFGGLKDYRSSEGRTVMMPYRGSMQKTIENILGGVRSACTYTGSKYLTELPFRSKFNRVYATHNRAYEQYTVGN